MTTDSDAAHQQRRATVHQPLRRESLADGAYQQIRRAILQGELEGGAVLKQVELARDMAVSTVPVREALRRLQAEQLLVASPFQRYVVRSLSPRQVAEYVDIHAALERLAMARLAEDEDDLATRLEAARERASQLDGDLDDERLFEADVAFHKTLHGDDAIVGQIIEDIRYKLRRYDPHALGRDRRARLREDHRRLLDAVAGRDVSAATAIAGEHALALHRHR